MGFTASWGTLLDRLDGLGDDATLITPLSNKRFQIDDVQEHRVIITLEDSGEKRPLQRDQFETLYRRIQDAPDGFELDRLPPDADPYPAVLSMHPRFEVDEERGVIFETDEPTTTQQLDAEPRETAESRSEPTDIDVYTDALLLIDMLERADVTSVEDLETASLIDLYTLLSDVQRNANDLRKTIADILLQRLHHDRPEHGQFGSVQRTSRTRRELKPEDEVLAAFEDAGLDPDRLMGVDAEKVDEALEVTDVSESEVYEIEESEYVRKAEVDDEVKETRLQGLKDQLAAADSEEAAELRAEIEDLEARIDELTSFRSGSEFA